MYKGSGELYQILYGLKEPELPAFQVCVHVSALRDRDLSLRNRPACVFLAVDVVSVDTG